MTEPSVQSIHASTEGAVAATHPLRLPLQVLAAPATEDQTNTLQPGLYPIACFRMEDVRFDFDSSLILPDVRRDLPFLHLLIEKLTLDPTAPGKPKRLPRLSIFGHADPVGSDQYNKALAGRRAAAFYALLTRRAEIWEDIYSNTGKFASVVSGDPWGARAIQTMLNALLDKADLDPPAPAAPLSGEFDTPTRNAIKKFQSAHGLATDGNPNHDTRHALFLAYMDHLCVDKDGHPFTLDPTDAFLGRNPKDSAGKADFQGCGEFNPMLLFAKEDLKRFDGDSDPAPRNRANAPNRRVMTLLFRPSVKVTPATWPCPLATEGVAACKKRFWSNGEDRRTNSKDQREFQESADTFACRFYHRLVSKSPCETAGDIPQQLAFRLWSENGLFPWKKRAFKVTGPDLELRGRTDDHGAFSRFPVTTGMYELTVEKATFVIPSIPRGMDPLPVLVAFDALPERFEAGVEPTPEELGLVEPVDFP
jgi:peptidoglycan hydrolase-like protein with peptidoglycan-binding domain